MATTTNRLLNKPTHGSLSGSWDSPINDNADYLDTMLGGVLTTGVSSGAYDLSATAYRYGVLRFTGTLAGNVTVTLPSAACFYVIDNQTTGSSYYVKFTTGSGEAIATPQGKAQDVFCDGTNVRFRNMPDPGSYWDWGGATVPVWIVACTVPPWLICDGSTFLIATYPQLAAINGTAFGGNGLTTSAVPDLQNRVRTALKASAARLTPAASGVDGTVRGASGGGETHTLTAGELPANIPNSASSSTTLTNTGGRLGATGHLTSILLSSGGASDVPVDAQTSSFSAATTTTVTINPSGGNPHAIVQPTLIHGLTFQKT